MTPYVVLAGLLVEASEFYIKKHGSEVVRVLYGQDVDPSYCV